jgi:hypothetical protein
MANFFEGIQKIFSGQKDSPEIEEAKRKMLVKLKMMEAENAAIENQIKNAISSGADQETLALLMQEKNSLKESYMQEMQSSLSQFPDMQKYAEKLANSKEVSSNISSLFSGIMDLRESNKQIKQGEQASRNVKPFESLPKFKQSNLLQDQIRNAKMSNTPGALNQTFAGAEGAIEGQYKTDINNAAVTSGGQSGSFAANSQAAARRKLQAVIDLQKEKLGFRNQNDRNLNYLAGQEINENQAADVSNRFRAGQDWDRYRFETENAAGLERAGRINKRNSRNYILGNVPDMMGMFISPNNNSGFDNQGRQDRLDARYNRKLNRAQRIKRQDFNSDFDGSLLNINDFNFNNNRRNYV